MKTALKKIFFCWMSPFKLHPKICQNLVFWIQSPKKLSLNLETAEWSQEKKKFWKEKYHRIYHSEGDPPISPSSFLISQILLLLQIINEQSLMQHFALTTFNPTFSVRLRIHPTFRILPWKCAFPSLFFPRNDKVKKVSCQQIDSSIFRNNKDWEKML